MRLVHVEGGHDLDQRDGGGDGRDENEYVEDEAEDGAEAAHGGEHVLQRYEQQARAGHGGVLAAEGDGRGQDCEGGHDGDQRVGGDDDERVLLDVLLLLKVGAVGDHGAHAQREREEHLPAGRGDDGHEVLLERLQVRLEHEAQALAGARQGDGADDDDEQHDKERGHGVLRELLDAARNAAHDYDAGERQEDDAVDDGLELVGQQAVEEVARRYAAAAPGRAEDVAQVHDDVLRDVAAEDGVEAHDEEGRGYAEPAEPADLLGQLLVGADDAEAGLAAQRQLADHDHEADEQYQQQVDDEEGEAAVGAHLIREAPEVAQADRGADRRHKEAEIASPITTFVFHNFPPLSFTPNRVSRPGKVIIKEYFHSFNRKSHILSAS